MEITKVILTSFLSAVSLFVIAKIMGHKQMSQLDFFDYITGITIGSIAAELATELEKPWKPLISMIIYGIITVCLTLITSKLPKTRKFINGTPTIIMNGGKIYKKNMKKAKMDLSEFMVMCRQEGYFNLNDISTAIFEYNGRLTILPKATKRPINPTDMNIIPPPASITTEVIMDGRILEDNLKRLGLNLNWLNNELKCQGYKSPKEIFLGICDDNNELTFFV
ncbi:MAG: DUF421 domain-containing protein [Ruminococcaceae bacterium]|nr:DUF421 domain-containing protein [Oscillospiraceae bacterium]